MLQNKNVVGCGSSSCTHGQPSSTRLSPNLVYYATMRDNLTAVSPRSHRLLGVQTGAQHSPAGNAHASSGARSWPHLAQRLIADAPRAQQHQERAVRAVADKADGVLVVLDQERLCRARAGCQLGRQAPSQLLSCSMCCMGCACCTAVTGVLAGSRSAKHRCRMSAAEASQQSAVVTPWLGNQPGVGCIACADHCQQHAVRFVQKLPEGVHAAMGPLQHPTR